MGWGVATDKKESGCPRPDGLDLPLLVEDLLEFPEELLPPPSLPFGSRLEVLFRMEILKLLNRPNPLSLSRSGDLDRFLALRGSRLCRLLLFREGLLDPELLLDLDRRSAFLVLVLSLS